MKLRRKILLAIILLVFIPVIALGSVSYYSFSQAMETKTSHFYWVSLQETDQRLKYALSEINSISNSAITQIREPSVQQMLKQRDYAMTYERRQEINNSMNHPMISSFAIYNKEELMYATGNALSYEDLRSQSWFSKVDKAEGRPVWIGPGENGAAGMAGGQGLPLLIQSRIIKDYYSLEDIGVLVIYVKPELLEQVFWDAATLNQGDILLVNKEGQLVFDKSGERIGEYTAFPFLQNGFSQGKGYYMDEYLGEKSLITYMPTHHDNWYLAAITPNRLITSESVSIRNIALILGAISLLSAFLFDRFFVRRMVRSIISAVNGMKRVKQGIFIPIPLQQKAEDETDLLIDGFNRMSTQIQELLQQVETEQARKKEAELQALVAQINPHFIYNSLESINSLAVLAGNREISKMVVSLGKLLRISISENQELISLSMELEHVRHYMNIQKFRFEDRFDYEIHLPEHLKHYLTQKLIVQPIVENALYHAIEPMQESGMISIRVSESGGDLLIDVEDNGPGFDPETLLKLGQQEQSQMKKYRENGVGLKNVHERLVLRFGSRYGIMICSSAGYGTTIRIRIPQILS